MQAKSGRALAGLVSKVAGHWPEGGRGISPGQSKQLTAKNGRLLVHQPRCPLVVQTTPLEKTSLWPPRGEPMDGDHETGQEPGREGYK